MVLQISPGPLPNDGDRIKVEPEMNAFVGGTDVKNFGRSEVTGGFLDAVQVQTEAPAEATRTRSTLWFKLGEGVLYRWALSPTGATEGNWLAMSTRREMLANLRTNVGALETLRVPNATSEFAGADGRFNHWFMQLANQDLGGNWEWGLCIPPFWVSPTAGTQGDFHVVVERGFTRVKVDAATTLAPLGFMSGSTSTSLEVLDNFYTHAGDRTGFAFSTCSCQTDAPTAFFQNVPTNLLL